MATAQKMIKPEEHRSLIHPIQNKKPVNTDSIEAITKESDKNVTGTFVNVEAPGQTAKVCCRLYPGMQYFSKVFQDGEKATIPLSVARFINERCQYEQHSYLTDEKGNPLKTGKFTSRYKFTADF